MGGVWAVFVRRPSGMVCDGWIFAVYCVRLLGIIGEMVELLVRFYDAIVRHTLCFFFAVFMLRSSDIYTMVRGLAVYSTGTLVYSMHSLGTGEIVEL